jgi:hypothetical protein
MPHQALDPIPVACEIVGAIQAMVTRTVDAFDPGGGHIARIEAGTTNNVIPESAPLTGTIGPCRRPAARARRAAPAGDGIARRHGAEAEVEVEQGYPVTVNDDGFAAFAEDVAAGRGGEASTVACRARSWGARTSPTGCSGCLAPWPSSAPRPAPARGTEPLEPDGPRRGRMASGIALHAAWPSRHLAPGLSGGRPVLTGPRRGAEQ